MHALTCNNPPGPGWRAAAPLALATLLGWTLLASAYAEPVEQIPAGTVGKVEFMSSTPKNRWTLARTKPSFANNAENPITVWGDLLLPPTQRPANGKYPAVVVSHGSEGVSPLYYDVWAKAFLAEGYAVFIVDSQKPRGVERNLGQQQLSWNTVGNIADGLYALKVLATDPDIDDKRIFHIGYSRGAAASMSSAWPIYQRPILPAGLHYAGHIALYGGCNQRYHEELNSKATAPMLLLLGEKDDMTPAQPCVDYAQSMQKAGMDVRYKVYPGAYHVFDRLDQRWARFKEGTFADCYIERTVTDKPTPPTNNPWGNWKTGERFTTDEQERLAQKECAKEKYITVESNPPARIDAVRETLAFINSLPAK